MMRFLAPRRMRGFTLIEMAVAVSVFALIAIGVGMANQYEAQKARGTRVGTAITPYAQALQAYVTTYRSQLANAVAISGVGAPLAPTVTELRTLSILSPAYGLTMPTNGGTPTFQIARIPTGCIGDGCDLSYLVYNSAPELNTDGTAAEGTLALASNVIGGTAGYSSATSAGTIRGQGGWSTANPLGSVAGIFGVFQTYSSSGIAGYVRIGDTRDPALAGNLTVAGTTSLAQLAVTGTTVIGGPTTLNSTVAIGGNLTAAGSTVLGGNASVIGSLNAQGQTTISNNLIVTGTLAVGGATAMSGPTSINNTLVVTGSVSGSSVSSTGLISGDRIALTTLYIAGAACSDTFSIGRGASGALVCQGGTWQPIGGLVSGTLGGPCLTSGAIAQGSSGVGLYCQSGTWVFLADRFGRFAVTDTYLVASCGNTFGLVCSVAKPACPAGGLPKIYLNPQGISSESSARNYRASDNASNWDVLIDSSMGPTAVAGSTNTKSYAVALVGCYYN